jgi:hypothetical protein
MRARLSACLCLTALCLTALIPAQGAARGTHHVYRGKTAQKLRIQLSVSAGQITPIRFKVTMLCRDGSLLHGDLSDFEGSPLKRNGSFSDTQYGPTDAVHWQGRLRGHKVSGSLRVTDRLSGGVRCDSGAVGFSARRVG